MAYKILELCSGCFRVEYSPAEDKPFSVVGTDSSYDDAVIRVDAHKAAVLATVPDVVTTLTVVQTYIIE